MSQTVSIRWFIVMIAFVGICCAVVGTVLGAMKASGREHLTVSLLMIGQYQLYSLQTPNIYCAQQLSFTAVRTVVLILTLHFSLSFHFIMA